MLSHYFDAGLWLPSWFGLSSSEWVYSVPADVEEKMNAGIAAVHDSAACGWTKQPQDVIDVEREEEMMKDAA